MRPRLRFRSAPRPVADARSRRWSWWRGAGVVCVLATAAFAHGQSTPHLADAIAELRRATDVQAGGLHLPRVFALRQLRDPALAPYFEALTHHEDWALQVHGALGLAELAAPPRLDPQLVARIAPDAREPLIANAIDMALLDRAGRQALLASAETPPLSRLMLLAEDHLEALPVDPNAVAPLATHEEPRVALLARALLQQFDVPSSEGVAAVIAAADRRERLTLTMWLLEAIRQYRLDALRPWIESVLSDPDRSRAERSLAVLALLEHVPDAGVVAFERELGADPRYADRIRFGLLLLDAQSPAPVETWRILARGLDRDETMVRTLVAVGNARATGAPMLAPVRDLLALDHPTAGGWVMSELDAFDRPTALALCRWLINRGTAADAPTRGRADAIERAVAATSHLFTLAPDDVLARLADAPDDSPAQEILLLGLFDHHDSRIGAAAVAVPRVGSGRADALALMLVARYADGLDEDDARRLGVIAAGGGRVSAGLRAQAAWLLLRHRGNSTTALRTVLAD